MSRFTGSLGWLELYVGNTPQYAGLLNKNVLWQLDYPLFVDLLKLNLICSDQQLTLLEESYYEKLIRCSVCV